MHGRVVMGSEKEKVESYKNLLCLDDDLDLLHSLLVRSEFLTKAKAKKLSGLTVNFDTGLRKAISQQRSRLINLNDDDSDSAEGKLNDANIDDDVEIDGINQNFFTSSWISEKSKTAKETLKHEIMEVQLTKKEKIPKPAGKIVTELKKRKDAKRRIKMRKM